LQIAESTVGVIFLGTPHQGCQVASWGRWVATLAPPGVVTEHRLLEVLEEQSDASTDRLHDFSRWLFSESVPTICGFERLVTDYSSRMGFMGKVAPLKELVRVANAYIPSLS